MLLLVPLLAFADDCRWPEVESVFASMTSVSINGEMVPARGRSNWEPLLREFQECDYYSAATALQKWRGQRRDTNITVFLGFITGGWAWVATPFTASAAGNWRARMEMELLRESEKRQEKLTEQAK